MTHFWTLVVDVVCWVLLLPTVGFLGYVAYQKSDDRRMLVLKWIVSVPLVLMILALTHLAIPYTAIIILAPSITLGLIWTPSVATALIKPLTGAFDGGNEEVEKAKPFYFLAEGKRRKGLYQEAIAEVRKQLEQYPGDYEGYMKLASIQMEDLKNLPAAQATLNEFMELPASTPANIVATLHLLADWQLQFARDGQAACRSLQRVVDLYPDTPFAHAAAQRIARLGTANEATEARYNRKFTVVPGEKDIGLRKETAPESAVADPDALAAEYVKQLELHPLDTETREKIAILYAEQFHRLDLASDQLEQLIAVPAEPPKHVARWLNLLATLDIKHAQNLEAAERALHRIIEKFPGGAQAEMAATRLAGLQGELKAGQKSPAKMMGSYKKDLGLKPGHGSSQ